MNLRRFSVFVLVVLFSSRCLFYKSFGFVACAIDIINNMYSKSNCFQIADADHSPDPRHCLNTGNVLKPRSMSWLTSIAAPAIFPCFPFRWNAYPSSIASGLIQLCVGRQNINVLMTHVVCMATYRMIDHQLAILDCNKFTHTHDILH